MSEKDKVRTGQVPSGLWEVTFGATNHLVGQIATLLDATLPDERQAKAAKDIAKTLIWERKNEMDRELERIVKEAVDAVHQTQAIDADGKVIKEV